MIPSRSRPWWVRWLGAVCAVASLLVAGACSSGDDGASSATDTTAPAAVAAFPGTDWARTDATAAGLDPARLDAVQQFLEDQKSDCMAVVKDGQVVRDVYWNGSDATTPHEVFSVTKSITSMLVGIAQADGKLAIDEPASDFVTEWKGTPSESVTIRDLLANASGRYWSVASDYGELIRTPDKTAYAIGLSQPDPPDTVWNYNNAAIQTLDAVVSRAVGEPTADFARQRLFEPVGMATTMTRDSAGNTLTFMGAKATCLDLARFGLLLLHGGEWNGRQVVPADYVAAATTTSTALNDAYGYLIWLNRPGVVRGPLGNAGPGPVWPDAPADAYAALGLGGQTVLVVPDQGLVVTRVGPAQGDTGGQSQLAGAIAQRLFGG